MSGLPPNLLTELEWRFRNGRDYDTRRIAGQAKSAIEKLQDKLSTIERYRRCWPVLDDLLTNAEKLAEEYPTAPEGDKT